MQSILESELTVKNIWLMLKEQHCYTIVIEVYRAAEVHSLLINSACAGLLITTLTSYGLSSPIENGFPTGIGFPGTVWKSKQYTIRAIPRKRLLLATCHPGHTRRPVYGNYLWLAKLNQNRLGAANIPVPKPKWPLIGLSISSLRNRSGQNRSGSTYSLGSLWMPQWFHENVVPAGKRYPSNSSSWVSECAISPNDGLYFRQS